MSPACPGPMCRWLFWLAAVVVVDVEEHEEVTGTPASWGGSRPAERAAVGFLPIESG